MDSPVTEADIRNELEYRMRLHGADDRSYDTIVASGPDHAARPHHEATRRTIVDGDTVIIDVGALVDGYHSDMTRSYVIGEPTAQQREIYALVEAAQRAGIDALRPGATAKDVDSACRDLFVEAGYGDWYLHGTGHGVGLVIHESPFHSQASDERVGGGERGDRRARALSCRLRWIPHRGSPRRHRNRRSATHAHLTATISRLSPTHERPIEGHPTMPQISVNDLKNGITLELDNGLFQVVEFQHVKPGKGGAFVRTKIRNARTGAVIDKTFNAGIKVEQAIVDRQDMQFLYKDGDDYVFMNTSTYDQMNVPNTALGDAADYLTEQMIAQIALYQGEIIDVEIAASVELTIAETEPGVQGDRVSGARKPATLETGKVLQVPLFVEPGDKIKVDTRTGDYITRV